MIALHVSRPAIADPHGPQTSSLSLRPQREAQMDLCSLPTELIVVILNELDVPMILRCKEVRFF